MIEEMENASRTVLCCPVCQESNYPQWNYCAKCGAALWEPCLHCGEPCAGGEDYCGACGSRRSDAAVEQVQRIEEDFRVAAEMAAAFRFEEALARLTGISKKDHPRLAEQAARAKELIGQLTTYRRQQQIAAEEAYQSARQCLDAFDCDGAARFMEKVSLSLENNEMRQFRSQVMERCREVDALTEALRGAVGQKQLLALPAHIERLLALKPDHAYAKSVAVQVEKQFVLAAQKMLSEHRYDQARHFLDKISVPEETADLRQLRRRVAEMAWLAWDLRNAPVVDATLVAVAKRLRQLAPQDTQTIQLCDVLQRRIRSAEGKQRQEPIPWARSPDKTAFDVPVEGLSGFRRIACAETLDRSELAQRPDSFAVACGLALAGLKQAAMRVNLLSVKQQGVLRRVSGLVHNQASRPAWGIDLGTSGLKAVKLAWNSSKKQAAIEATAFVEHAKPLGHAVDEEEETRLVTETFKAFLNAHETKTDRVCVGLPGRMTFSRQIKIPPATSAKASKLVQYEAAHQFPIPLSLLDWDFQVFEASGNQDRDVEPSDKKNPLAFLIAAKRTTTERFMEAFQGLGVHVNVFQPDFVGLHNFLVHDYLVAPGDPSPAEACSVVAALDIGGDTANLVVSSPGSLWTRSCGVSGHHFTRALVKEFDLSLAQAEQQKRAPQSAESFSDIHEAWSPVFDDLLKEVRQALAAYAGEYPHKHVQRVVGLGGGFALHGLLRYLRCGR